VPRGAETSNPIKVAGSIGALNGAFGPRLRDRVAPASGFWLGDGHGRTSGRAAIDSVFAYSGGIPRMINHAASLALLECFGRGVDQVDSDVMDAVMLELDNNLLPQDRG